MKAVKVGMFKSLNREKIRREVDEELQFHLDLLTDEHLQLDLPLAAARAAALERFGNLERIKDECVEISRRRHPLLLAIKSFLVLVFIGGVLLRIYGVEIQVRHCADVMMMIGVLGRLFLYARGLRPSSFLTKPEAAARLMLIDRSESSIAAYDRRQRTPVERVILDK